MAKHLEKRSLKKEPFSLEKRIRLRLSQGRLNVLAMPRPVAEVLRLLDAETTTTGEIAHALGRDQALATHLLALANSAFYRGAKPVSAIEQAVVRLGLREIKGMVLMISLKGLFKENEHPALARPIWHHSLAAALLARDLASACTEDPDEAFTAGLVHDIGKMAVMAVYEELVAASEIAAVSDAVLAPLLSQFHVEAGRMLAEEWDLPPATTEAIATHHSDMSLIKSRIGRLVAVANGLAVIVGFAAPSSPPVSDDVRRACLQAGVDAAQQARLLKEIPQMLAELELSTSK